MNKLTLILAFCLCSCSNNRNQPNKVNIEGCRICTSLEDAIVNKDSVYYLVLTSPEILNYEELKSFPKLKGITLVRYNNVDFDLLFRNLFQIKNLNELTLDDCSLDSIPNSISYLENITSLFIFNDSITHVDKEFYSLNSLSELRISKFSCGLNSDSIKKMTSLSSTYFDFEDETLPEYIYSLYNLKKLKLPANVASIDIGRLAQLKELTLLDVTGTIVSNEEWNYYKKHGKLNRLSKLKDKLPNLKIYMAPSYY